MEETGEESPPSKTCGSCRRIGTDLKICTACRSIHYCNVTCQKAHRKAHKKDCKEIAHAKEVMEEFKANPMTEECPICMMRLPLAAEGSYYRACCGKTLCCGCIEASRKAQGLDFADPYPPCAFCRQGTTSDEELLGWLDERMNKHGDDKAFFAMAGYYRLGQKVPKDNKKAFKCFVRASEMGNAHGMYAVAVCYMNGTGVPIDEEKAEVYLEMAAKNGHVGALVELATIYCLNLEVGIGYLRLAAENGHEEAMERLKKLYRVSENAVPNHTQKCKCAYCKVYKTKGLLTKDDLAATIRAFHSAQGELRSDERDRAQRDLARELITAVGTLLHNI